MKKVLIQVVNVFADQWNQGKGGDSYFMKLINYEHFSLTNVCFIFNIQKRVEEILFCL